MRKSRRSSRMPSSFILKDKKAFPRVRQSASPVGIHIPMTLYTVADVQAAHITLEPLICIFCGSQEITYLQYIGDGQCARCGKWQTVENVLSPPVSQVYT